MPRAGRPKLPVEPCMTPKCPGKFGLVGEPGGRGLCKACHSKAALLVKRCFTTWEEMEALGLAQPKYGSLVEKAIEEARRKRTLEEADRLAKEDRDANQQCEVSGDQGTADGEGR